LETSQILKSRTEEVRQGKDLSLWLMLYFQGVGRLGELVTVKGCPITKGSQIVRNRTKQRHHEAQLPLSWECRAKGNTTQSEVRHENQRRLGNSKGMD